MIKRYHDVIAGGSMAEVRELLSATAPRVTVIRPAVVAVSAAFLLVLALQPVASGQQKSVSVPPTTISTQPPPAGEASAAKSGVAEMQVIPVERANRLNSLIEPVEEDYRIGSQDLLEIQVLGVQDLKREVRVNAKGMVGLPLIGSVRVAGLTTYEAEAMIGGLYRKDYLQNPEVSVFVKEFTRQSVTLEGAVAKPGQYALKGPTTLLQALAIAGGQGSLSDMSDVIVFRMEDNERRAFKFDVNKIRKAEASDPLLQPGDMIVVNRSEARVAIRDSLLGDIIGIFNPFNYIYRP